MAKFAQINKPQATLPQQADAPYRAPWSHRISSALLAAIFTVYVTIPSYAGSIQVDAAAAAANQAGLANAANGIQVINIVTPNGAGVSHNKFTNFNVGSSGAILNNSAAVGSSHLAGVLLNNPNLASGNEARLILNEVTGASTSALHGPTEIFGRSAEYILANPNGITCNGCGFINTPRATLTTGTPNFDASGNLSSLNVQQGTVSVDIGGLDASLTTYFDIVSRAIEINGAIHGQDVALHSGRQTYDYATKTTTALADDGSAKPIFGIDSTLLGGLYANRITLVGTENGVGVRAPEAMAATGGDLKITADGRIVLRDATTTGMLAATSTSADIDVERTVHGDGNVILTASDGLKITAGGTVNGGNTVALSANAITNAGSIASDRNLSIGANNSFSNQGTVGSGANLTVTTTRSLANQGTLTSAGPLTVVSSGTITNAGTIGSESALSLSAINDLSNSGTLASNTDAYLESGGSIVNSGSLSAQGGLTLDARKDVENVAGKIIADHTNISAHSLRNQADISSVNIDVGLSGDLENSGAISATNTLTVTTASTLKNLSGSVAAKTATFDVGDIVNAGKIETETALTVTSTGVIHNSDTLSSVSKVSLSSSGLTNDDTGTILGQSVTLTTPTAHNTGKISSESNLSIVSSTLENANLIQAKGALTIDATEAITSTAGTISGNSIALTAKNITNHAKLVSSTALNTFGQTLTNTNLLQASGALSLDASAKIANSSGTISGHSVTLAAPTIFNDAQITSSASLDISGDTLTNSDLLQAQTYISAALTDSFRSTSGTVRANSLTLSAPNISNTSVISSDGDLTITGTTLTNENVLQALGQLIITETGSITNNSGKLVGQSIELTSPTITNKAQVLSSGDISLFATNLTNSDLFMGLGNLNFEISDTVAKTSSSSRLEADEG